VGWLVVVSPAGGVPVDVEQVRQALLGCGPDRDPEWTPPQTNECSTSVRKWSESLCRLVRLAPFGSFADRPGTTPGRRRLQRGEQLLRTRRHGQWTGASSTQTFDDHGKDPSPRLGGAVGSRGNDSARRKQDQDDVFGNEVNAQGAVALGASGKLDTPGQSGRRKVSTSERLRSLAWIWHSCSR
jgi:hypothetical protein